jgi:hypothetical protein
MTTIELGKTGKTLKLTDTLEFGKFKGKPVDVLLGTQAGYICWLVDQELSGEGKKKGYEALFFDTELLMALSNRIKASPSLRRDYEHLILEGDDVEAYEELQRQKEEAAQAAELARVNAIQQQYANIGWASW